MLRRGGGLLFHVNRLSAALCNILKLFKCLHIMHLKMLYALDDCFIYLLTLSTNVITVELQWLQQAWDHEK